MGIFRIQETSVQPVTRGGKRPKAIKPPCHYWAWLALTTERRGGIPLCSQFLQQAHEDGIYLWADFEGLRRGRAAGSHNACVHCQLARAITIRNSTIVLHDTRAGWKDGRRCDVKQAKALASCRRVLALVHREVNLEPHVTPIEGHASVLSHSL